MSSVWHPIHTQSWAQWTGRYERKIRIEWRELIAWHSNNGCLLSILASIPCQVVNLVCNIPKSRLMLYFKEGHFANRYSHTSTPFRKIWPIFCNNGEDLWPMYAEFSFVCLDPNWRRGNRRNCFKVLYVRIDFNMSIRIFIKKLQESADNLIN